MNEFTRSLLYVALLVCVPIVTACIHKGIAMQSTPPDVKSWTTFFTNKFEKTQKISPTRLSIGFEPI